MTAVRKIIHIDMDAFFAAVEQRDCPELRGKPIAVGGDPCGRGVVSSASYEARRYGVRSAMSCAQAARICRGLIFVRPHFDRYFEVSAQLKTLFATVTDRIEPLSLDEAYLDVTENFLGEKSATRIAWWLKRKIYDVLGLTSSAGVAPNKFIAKIASDWQKPNGLVTVAPHQVSQFVERLPVERLWGVGPALRRRLEMLGIFTTADIRQCGREIMERSLGKYGLFIYELAHGHDPRAVEVERPAKSRGTESTFSTDQNNATVLEQLLEKQTIELADFLVERCLQAQTVTLKLRYSDFKTITRSRSLVSAATRQQELMVVARELLLGAVDSSGLRLRPVRLLGLTVSGLRAINQPGEQLCFPF